MADLQEALAARERRSRIITIVVGVAIFAVLAFLLIRLNSNDNNVAENNGEGTEQSEEQSSEEQTLSDILADVDNNQEENAEPEQSEGVNLNNLLDDEQGQSEEEDSVAVQSTEDSSNKDTALPNTGPEDAALLGIFAVIAGAYYYSQSRKELAHSLLR